MDNAHRMLYKHEGVDSTELRRRRIEEGVQLRKQKREMLMLENRNVQRVEVLSMVPNQVYDWAYINETLVKTIYGNNEEAKLQAAQSFRQFLVTLQESPINEIINTGIIPKYVEFMKNLTNSQLQYEAVWVVDYVSNGLSAHVNNLIDAGAVSVLINMLMEVSRDDTKELAITSLGNIIAHSDFYRNYILDKGIIGPLLKVLDTSVDLQVIRNCVWVMSCLCDDNSSSPDFNKVSPILPALTKLLYHKDSLVLVETCWTLSYLANGPKYNILTVFDYNVFSVLTKLLLHSEECVVVGALRAIGNILSGDKIHCQVLLDCSILPGLRVLSESTNQSIRKDVCWILSNITAGSESHIQAVIDANIFPIIMGIMMSDIFITQKEAVWVVANATNGGTTKQIEYLVQQDCIPSLSKLLNVGDNVVIKIALNGLENILKVGKILAEEAGTTTNRYADLMEEYGTMVLFESLQIHKNTYINQKALELLECFFPAGDNDLPFEQRLAYFRI